MAIVKSAHELYVNNSDVVNALNYICDLYKCDNCIYSGRNISMLDMFDPNLFAIQFLAVQDKRRFTKRIHHVIISFDQISDSPDLNFCYQVGMAVTGLYQNYQSVFTVHEDKNFLHLHIIFNNCSIFPDVKNLTSYFSKYAIQNLVDKMIFAHLGIPDLYLMKCC